VVDDGRKRRLSFKERQELDGLPAVIEQIEADIAKLHGEMAEPAFYQQAGEVIAKEQARLKLLDGQLLAAYERLEVLDGLKE
jgi:ATP-binding cassette subfamily F protein uup